MQWCFCLDVLNSLTSLALFLFLWRRRVPGFWALCQSVPWGFCCTFPPKEIRRELCSCIICLWSLAGSWGNGLSCEMWGYPSWLHLNEDEGGLWVDSQRKEPDSPRRCFKKYSMCPSLILKIPSPMDSGDWWMAWAGNLYFPLQTKWKWSGSGQSNQI